jgi:hypothetical protein
MVAGIAGRQMEVGLVGRRRLGCRRRSDFKRFEWSGEKFEGDGWGANKKDEDDK